MFRFFRGFACFLIVLVGLSSTGAFAAGYTCSKTYTKCKSPYYLSSGSCYSCTSLQNTASLGASSISHGARVTKCNGYYTSSSNGTSGGTGDSNSCSGCSSTTTVTECESGYTPSGTTCVCSYGCSGVANTETWNEIQSCGSHGTGTQTVSLHCIGNYTSSGCYSGGETCSGCSKSEQKYATACVMTSCDSGYYLSSGSCYPCTDVSFTESGTDSGPDYDYSGSVCTETSKEERISISNGSYIQVYVRDSWRSRTYTRSKSRTCYRTGGAGGTNGSSACTGSTNCGSWSYGTKSYGSWSACSYGEYEEYYIRAYSCNAGYYWDGSACKQCTAGYYCPGFTDNTNPTNGTGRTQCPSGYPNSDAGVKVITKCYSNSKSRAWTGSQSECTTSDVANSYSVTCASSCSYAACSYVAYSNSAGTGDGTIKSGCSTNNDSCKKSVSSFTCKAGYYKNGSTCSACSAGTYQPTNGSTATSCTACATGSYNTGTANTSCTACTSGKTTSGTGKTSCDANCSNAANVSAWETATWASNSVTNLCKIKTCTAATKGTGAASATVAISNNACVYSGTCSAKYVKPTASGVTVSCMACPTAYPNSTAGNTYANDNYCYLTLTAGKQVASAGAGASNCAKGKYCNSTANIFKGTAGGTATYTGTACQTGSYQDTEGQSVCKPCAAGKTNSGTGNTAACTTACTSIANLSTWATTSWSNGTVSNLCTVGNCAANSYKSGNTCPTCSSGTSSKYTLSAAGTTSVNSCYLKTTAGKYVKTAKSGEEACPANSYCAGGTTIYYGTGTQTGGSATCSAGTSSKYTLSAAGASKVGQCYLTLTAGYQVASAGAGKSACAAGKYCTSTANIYYNTDGGTATYTGTNCPAGTYSTGGATSSACTAALSGYTAAVCATNTWSAAGASSCTACTTANGYGNSGTAAANHANKSSCTVSCAAGKQVASAGAACTTPSGSWYTGTHTVAEGSTSGTNIKSCATSYATKNTTTQTDHDAATDCTITCAAGTRVASANAACTTPSGNWYTAAQHTVAQGSTSGTNCASGYSISGTATTDHDNANDCKITCNAGYYIASAGGACAACPAGKYCNGGSTNQTAALAATGNCPAGTYSNGGATSSACTAAISGKTAAVCAENTYSNAGASSCTACGTANGYKNSGTTAASHAGVASCKASCAAGTRVASANAACTAITSGNVYMLAHTVNQGSTSAAATSCPTGYTISGTAQTDHDQKADCKISCGAGTQVAAADAACTTPQGTTWYTAAHTVSAGSTSGTNVKTCNSGYATANTATATDHDNANDCKISCSAGYYIASAGGACAACPAGKYCNGGSTNQTAALAATGNCPAGTYSNGGATSSACTAAISGKTAAVCATNTWSAAGASSCTACTTANGYGNSGTAAANHANKSSCTVSCAAGKQVASAGAACTTPSGSWYTAAHTVAEGNTSGTNIKSCATSYATKNTTTQTDHDAATDCTITCAAGTRVASANAACTTPSGNWYTAAQHTVAQGSTSGTNCASGYSISGTATTDHDNANDCKISCAAGSRVTTANGACTAITSGNVYMLAHTVNQGSTSAAATSCPTGYTISGTAQTDHDQKADCKISCSGGTRVATADAQCTNADAGYYIAAHTVSAGSTSAAATQCPANYRNGAAASAESGCTASCAAGTYVATAKAACTSVGTGYYRAAHTVTYGNTSTRTQCPANYRAGAATSAESECQAHCTGGTRVATAKAACAGTVGYYIGAHYVKYGATSAAATACSNKPTNSAYTGYAETNTCSWECNAGAYLNNNACSLCGAGTYKASAGNATSCTTCSAGTYNTTTGNTSCTACPAGKYCTGGTNTTNCAAGTYRSATGGKVANDCSSCPTLTSGYSYTTTTGLTAVTSCTETKAASGYCYSGALTKTAKDASTWNTATSTLTAKAGAHLSGSGDSTTCAQCSGATYQTTNGSTATSCTACPNQTSGWTRGTGTGWTSYSSCYETQTPANCASGSVKHTASSASAWNSAVTLVTQLKSNAGYYASATATSCTICPAGSYCPASATGATACATGSYASGTGNSGCTACTNGATTSGTGKTSCDATCSNKTDNVNSWKAASWSANSVTNLCTIDQCKNATYLNSNACSACPTAESGWTQGTGTGWTAATSCYETKSVGGNCSAGQLKKNASSATAWSTTTTISVALQAKAGSYVNGQTCTQCSGATYSAGGTKTSCDDCPTAENGWTQGSGNGWSAYGSCYETKSVGGNCSAGQLKKNASSATAWPTTATISVALQAKAGSYVNGQTCTQCSGATYSAGGTKTSCDDCPAATDGWTRNTGTGWSVVTSCNQTKAVGGNCSEGTLRQNATSATAWGSSEIATALKAKAGSYVNGQTCTQCGAGTYQGTNGSTVTSCTAASKGYYASGTGNTSQTACGAGTYTSATGKSACTNAAAGTYTTGCQITTNNTACTGTAVCANNTWSDAKASSCTACSTAKGYTNSGTAAANHAGQESCQVTCGGGSYVATAGAGCTNVTAGYWSAGGTANEKNGTIARTQCATGLTTIGYGAGADEAADCGHILHVGENKVYLRSEKKTSPALHVKVEDTIFYGNMSTETKGKVRIKKDNTTYSVYDDSI